MSQDKPVLEQVEKWKKLTKAEWQYLFSYADFVALRDLALSASQSWISVEERLPEHGNNVLVLDHYVSGSPLVKIAAFLGTDNGKWIASSGACWSIEDKPWVDRRGPRYTRITHWMPLPLPPHNDHEPPQVPEMPTSGLKGKQGNGPASGSPDEEKK